MDETPKIPLSPPDLPGEAPPGAYGVKDQRGELTDPRHGIFPIVRYDDEGHLHLLGTGFFITENGIFITARHVLQDPFDEAGREKYPIGLIQFPIEGGFVHRPILRCAEHPIADLAVGIAAQMEHDGIPLKSTVVTLSIRRPEIGTRIVTFAYPKHASVIEDGIQRVDFRPRYYDGELLEYYPTGRDRTMMPGPCYGTTIRIHGGASGGPVFSPNGYVFGLNSTNLDGSDISFVTRVDEVFSLQLDDVILGDEPARSVPIIDIARTGAILVDPKLEDIRVVYRRRNV